MLAKHCNSCGCQSLVSLLVQRKAVVDQQESDYIRIVLIHSQVEDIHAMLGHVQQVYLLGGEQDHNFREALGAGDPEGVQPLVIPLIDVDLDVAEELRDHLFAIYYQFVLKLMCLLSHLAGIHEWEHPCFIKNEVGIEGRLMNAYFIKHCEISCPD